MNHEVYAQPFWHAIIPQVVWPDVAYEAAASIKVINPKAWVKYSSPFEHGKRTCRDPQFLQGSVLRLMGYLSSSEFTGIVRQMTGVADLIPAPFDHGGGIHVMIQGGKLDPHIDFAMHPECEFLERRFSLVLYLGDSGPDDGGELCLWDDSASYIEKTILPKFNQAVLFENSDISYHSVNPVRTIDERVSLAMYYCAPIRPGVRRKRALWVPIRT